MLLTGSDNHILQRILSSQNFTLGLHRTDELSLCLLHLRIDANKAIPCPYFILSTFLDIKLLIT